MLHQIKVIMKTEKIFKQELEALQNNVISTIKSHIERITNLIAETGENNEYDEIRLPSPIIHQYIDENMNETIASISFIGDNHVIIDTNLNDYNLPLAELKLEALICIVGQLEAFEKLEDVEMQLI